MTWIYGRRTLESLVKQRPEAIRQVYLGEQHANSTLVRFLEETGLQFKLVGKTWFQKLEDANGGSLAHQQVAAQVEIQSYHEKDLEHFQKDSKTVFLVLDGIQDPHNLGACLRTAEAFGVTAVVLPKDRSAPLTPTVRKVASGAAELLPIMVVNNLARCMESLKQQGVWFYGTRCDSKSSALWDLKLQGPLAWVMGSEGHGLRALTVERCDFLVHIPLLGSTESLNVSVATGIVLSETAKQLNHTQLPRP